MYQGQSTRPGQNKRMRGRNSNGGGNRKGPNPLTRSYESNGPDVKIRGTAQHVGEKYLQLARDAQTSGDPVAAESYLQHAEHYFRIIAAAHQAQQQAQPGYIRQPGDTELDDNEEEDDLGIMDRFASPPERTPPVPVPVVQQPYAERPVYNGERPNGPDRQAQQDRPVGQERSGGAERYERQDGQDRQFRPERERYGQDRDQRPDRGYPRPAQERGNYVRNDRGDRQMNRGPRDGQDQRDNRDQREARPEQRENRDMQFRDQPRLPIQARELPQEPRPQPQPVIETAPELPAFITAPVRVVVPPSADLEQQPVLAAPATTASASSAESPSEPQIETFAVRPRRRRRTRLVDGESAASDTGGEPPLD